MIWRIYKPRHLYHALPSTFKSSSRKYLDSTGRTFDRSLQLVVIFPSTSSFLQTVPLPTLKPYSPHTMHPLLAQLRAYAPTARRSTITTLQLLTAFHLFTTDIAEIRLCSGFSMLPTLSHQGDFVLISPIPLRFFESRMGRAARGAQEDEEGGEWGIKRGDIVIATSPTDPSKTVCKRVIGLEGDIIEVDPTLRSPRRRIRKDPAPTWEQIDAQHRQTVQTPDSEILVPVFQTTARSKSHVHIPRGHVWLTGDNLSNSTDSRAYGPVPVALLKGKVLARVSLFVSFL
jgi:inner membrane protease subunit 1